MEGTQRMKTTDLFGDEREQDNSHIEPSAAWQQGWECGMYNGWKENPFVPGSDEYEDFDAGYEAAERD